MKHYDTYDVAGENAARFTYCPGCGAAALRPDSTKSLTCGRCGFTLFLNAAAAVCAVIVDEGCMLLTVRNEDPAAGTLDLPGGFVDPYESLEDALRREVKEELDLDVTAARYLCSVANRYAYGGVVYATIDAAYACRVTDARKAKARDDVSAVRFIPLGAIDPDACGLASVREILRRYLAEYD